MFDSFGFQVYGKKVGARRNELRSNRSIYFPIWRDFNRPFYSLFPGKEKK